MPDSYKRQQSFYLQSSISLLMAVLMTQATVAHAQIPSQEFWEYMEDYDDGKGELIDPLEYDEIVNLKNDSGEYNEPNELMTRQQHDNHADNPNMKFAKKSSAQTSSKAMRGAAQ